MTAYISVTSEVFLHEYNGDDDNYIQVLNHLGICEYKPQSYIL